MIRPSTIPALDWLLSQPQFLLTESRLTVTGPKGAYTCWTEKGETAEDLVDLAYEELVLAPARAEIRRGEP